MATLAPNIPTQGDPEYLRYSRPIQGVEGNKAGYYLAKGLGDAVEQGVSEADKIVGHYAEQKAFERGDEARKAEEERIDPIWRQTQGLPQDANSEFKASAFQPTELDGSQSVIQKNQDLPPEIRFGTKNAASLNERFMNGKMSQTDYMSEVDKIAKDLNSRFPAYRTQIAQGLERSTGVAGADAMIRSKIQDINRVLSQLNEQKNKVDSQLFGALDNMPDDVRANLLHRRFNLSPDDPNYLSDTQALYHAGHWKAIDVDQERTNRAYQIKEHQRTASQEDFKDAVGKIVSSGTERFMHSFAISNGVDTFDQLTTKLNDPNLSDSDKLKLASTFQQNLDAFKAQLRKDVGPLMGTKGSSGYAEVNTQITAATAFLDEQAKRMRDTNDPLNPLMAAKNYLEAQGRDIHWMIAQQPEAIKRRVAKAIDDINPSLAGTINQDILANENDFTANNKGLYDNAVRSLIGIPRNDPNARNAKDYIDVLGHTPRAAMDIVGIANKIQERGLDDEKAYRIAKGFFDPKNQGMVGKFALDAYDPRTGKTTQGQINVFKILGSEGIANRILELSKKHPDIFTDYTNFMQNTFKHEVFPTLLDSVKDLSMGSQDRLSYNTETQQFDLKKRDIQPGTFMSSNIARQSIGMFDRQLESTKNKLNFVFGAMKNVAKISGEKDPNAYLIRLLMEERHDLFRTQVPGFPGEINKAILNQIQAKEIEKQQKAKAIQESQ